MGLIMNLVNDIFIAKVEIILLNILSPLTPIYCTEFNNDFYFLRIGICSPFLQLPIILYRQVGSSATLCYSHLSVYTLRGGINVWKKNFKVKNWTNYIFSLNNIFLLLFNRKWNLHSWGRIWYLTFNYMGMLTDLGNIQNSFHFALQNIWVHYSILKDNFHLRLGTLFSRHSDIVETW